MNLSVNPFILASTQETSSELSLILQMHQKDGFQFSSRGISEVFKVSKTPYSRGFMIFQKIGNKIIIGLVAFTTAVNRKTFRLGQDIVLGAEITNNLHMFYGNATEVIFTLLMNTLESSNKLTEVDPLTNLAMAIDQCEFDYSKIEKLFSPTFSIFESTFHPEVLRSGSYLDKISHIARINRIKKRLIVPVATQNNIIDFCKEIDSALKSKQSKIVDIKRLTGCCT